MPEVEGPPARTPVTSAPRETPEHLSIRISENQALDLGEILESEQRKANAGLGKAIATELARRGGRVIMAGHTLDESARDDIRGRSGNSEVSSDPE